MRANQAEFSVQMMCEVLSVSPSGYYAWRKRPPSHRAVENERLLGRMREIHTFSRETYGQPRMYAELRDDGWQVNHKRVRRLMRLAGLQGATRRRKWRTTKRNRDARPAPDLVARDFSVHGPDQLWVADITYVPTWERLLVPVSRRRCVEPPCGRMVDEDASQDRSRARRAEHGAAATTTERCHPS